MSWFRSVSAAMAALTLIGFISAGCSDAKTRAKLGARHTPAAKEPAPSKAAQQTAAPGGSGGSGEKAPPSAPQAATSPGSLKNLPGATDDLAKALAESAVVSYRIITVEDVQASDVSTYFDHLVQQMSLLDSNTLVLAVFTKAGNDIRFVMGPGFNQKKVTVDSMLGLIRSNYLPEARKGDPAAGLAGLIRAVNRQMEAGVR